MTEPWLFFILSTTISLLFIFFGFYFSKLLKIRNIYNKTFTKIYNPSIKSREKIIPLQNEFLTTDSNDLMNDIKNIDFYFKNNSSFIIKNLYYIKDKYIPTFEIYQNYYYKNEKEYKIFPYQISQFQMRKLKIFDINNDNFINKDLYQLLEQLKTNKPLYNNAKKYINNVFTENEFLSLVNSDEYFVISGIKGSQNIINETKKLKSKINICDVIKELYFYNDKRKIILFYIIMIIYIIAQGLYIIF